jgi:hypothetical protein
LLAAVVVELRLVFSVLAELVAAEIAAAMLKVDSVELQILEAVVVPLALIHLLHLVLVVQV